MTKLLASFIRFLVSPKWYSGLLIALIVIAIYLVSGTSHHLLSPDEARYVGIAGVMHDNHYLVDTEINNIPFFHKPPLFYWVTLLGIGIFGENLIGYRFASILASLVIIFSWRWFLRRNFNRIFSGVATLALTFSLPIWLASQYANTDQLVAAMITATALCGVEAGARLKAGLPAKAILTATYVFAALGLLAKGLIGVFLPGGVIFFWLFFTGKINTFFKFFSWRLIIIFVIIGLLPLIIINLYYPKYLYYFFVEQQFLRFLSPGTFNNVRAWYFYLPLVVVASLPWVVLWFTNSKKKLTQNFLAHPEVNQELNAKSESTEVEKTKAELAEVKAELAEVKAELATAEDELSKAEAEFTRAEAELKQTTADLASKTEPTATVKTTLGSGFGVQPGVKSHTQESIALGGEPTIANRKLTNQEPDKVEADLVVENKVLPSTSSTVTNNKKSQQTKVAKQPKVAKQAKVVKQPATVMGAEAQGLISTKELMALCVIWVVLITGFFSIPQSKLVGYILPAVSPVVIFCLLPVYANYQKLNLAFINFVQNTKSMFVQLIAFMAVFFGMTYVGLILFEGKLIKSSYNLKNSQGEVFSIPEPKEEAVIYSLGRFPYAFQMFYKYHQPMHIILDLNDPEILQVDNWRKEIVEGMNYFKPEAKSYFLSEGEFALELCQAKSPLANAVYARKNVYLIVNRDYFGKDKLMPQLNAVIESNNAYFNKDYRMIKITPSMLINLNQNQCTLPAAFEVPTPKYLQAPETNNSAEVTTSTTEATETPTPAVAPTTTPAETPKSEPAVVPAPEVKPESQPESKPEVKPEAQPETQPTTNPAQPGTAPEQPTLEQPAPEATPPVSFPVDPNPVKDSPISAPDTPVEIKPQDETPENSDVQLPAVPNTAPVTPVVVPEVPNNPATSPTTPTVPEQPVTPAVPAQPAQPATPEVPATPVVPTTEPTSEPTTEPTTTPATEPTTPKTTSENE